MLNLRAQQMAERSGRPARGLCAGSCKRIGNLIERYDFRRPAHTPRKASYIMTDTDIALNSADVEVGDLLSDGWMLTDAVAAIAKKRGLPASKLSEHHARRRRSQRKR